MEIGIALLVLVAGAGAWGVWRRSPRYSLGASLLTLAVLLATITAVIAVTRWIGESTAIRTTTAKMALTLLACLLAVVALTVVVVRLTEGPASKPAGGSVPAFHRRKLRPVALIAAGVAALCGGSALLGPGSWREAGSALTGLCVFIAAVTLLGLYLKARRLDYGAAALARDAWVRWRCRAADESDAGHHQVDVAFGTGGILIGCEYTPWRLSGSYLTKASIARDEPRALRLTLRVYAGGAGQVTKRIPIPDGSEGDLELLQRRLRACFPNASIDLAP